jgi:alpha-tubulin suppressor-like RCC1 family protein
MSMIRTLVLLLIPIWFLNGCGGAGEDKTSATPPATSGISVSPDTTITTDEYGLAGSLSVSLSSKPTADVTIPVSSSDTTEGTVDKTSLVFTSADWSTPQTITVTGVNDTTADGNQNYTIQLGPTTSTASAYNALEKAVSAVNLDIMDGSIAVSPISGDTSESGTTATFTVRLGSAPTAEVTIPITSSNTAEGTVDKSSLLFSTTDWDQYQTVTVTGVGDTTADGNQSFNIQLAPAISTDPKYSGLDPIDVAVTNLNVKRGFVTVSAISGNTDESGYPATFTVQLNIQPAADVEMTITSSNPAEGTVSTPITFKNGESLVQTVTVTGVDDSAADDNQPYSIDIGTTSSTDDNFNGLTPTPATVSVTNVDLVDPYGVTPQISAGNYHNLVLASDGTVWGWGQCNSGQIDAAPLDAFPNTCPGSSFILPQRLNITGASAVSAGFDYSAIVKTDGSVWTSGVNDSVLLGHTGGGNGAPLAQVVGLTNVETVAAGDNHVLALKNDHTVWAWGHGSSGQLGDGSTVDSPTPVLAALTGINITAIAAGEKHSLALDNLGNVYSWGNNSDGQLGRATTVFPAKDPTVIDQLTGVSAIGAGSAYSFAVGATNTYGWGDNGHYQLGTGATGDKTVPTMVNTFSSPAPTRIDGGYQHSLALVGSAVYAWGDNDDNTETTADKWDNRGALGRVMTIPTDSPSPIVPTGWGGTATEVSAGRNFSLVLLSDGRLQSSGKNLNAQLGTNQINSGTDDYTDTPAYVEDPGDPDSVSIIPFYAYRPILSGQPATSTTSTSATITVCWDTASNLALPSCGPISQYKYKTDTTAWSGPISINTPISLPSSILIPGTTVTLWVIGINASSTEMQTDTSAVKASWNVVAP